MLILPFYLHASLMTSKNLLICCFRDKIKTEQIVKSLNLKISARDSRHCDSRVLLKALFDQWLPLSSSLLSMVIDKLPSPAEILSERVEKLMCSGVRTFDSLPDETQSLKDGELRRLFSLSFLAVAPNLFCIVFALSVSHLFVSDMHVKFLPFRECVSIQRATYTF